MTHPQWIGVEAAYAAIAEADRSEVWVSLRSQQDVAAEVTQRLAEAAAGADLPLAGSLVAVKDNIDVAGLPTTAACPGAVAHPQRDATAVRRLRAAGAVVIGKTNLDQFATGLVGTRSPYGAVRHARWPERISGGSSSGSAVAVALGFADAALGTDTAGSGRVPAALHGLIGVKTTPGVIPTTGVVPACRSLDCVTVLSRTHVSAHAFTAIMAGPDGEDALASGFPSSAPLAAARLETLTIAVPDADGLAPLDPVWRAAFERRVGDLVAAGASIIRIDIRPFLDAAALLYDGAFVAERYAAVGDLVAAGVEGLDPTVASIIRAAGAVPAHRLAADRIRLAELKARAEANWADADALLMPTTTHHPTIAAVQQDPIGENSRLGTYTNFANLFRYPAVAVPIRSGQADASVGVQVLARPFHDAVVRDLALVIGEHEESDAPDEIDAARCLPGLSTASCILLVGAHRTGFALHDRVRRHGAVRLSTVRTAPGYRMHELGDEHDRPGVVRDESWPGSVLGEVWAVPTPALADLLLESAAPLGLGPVELEDGSTTIGYLCEAHAAEGKRVVASGDWAERGTAR